MIAADTSTWIAFLQEDAGQVLTRKPAARKHPAKNLPEKTGLPRIRRCWTVPSQTSKSSWYPRCLPNC